jgi:hypothetical protein
MADNHITAEPTTLEEFLDTAKDQGFAHDPTNSSIIHADGRGCFGISEEEHGGDTYVGCMNDPQLDGIELHPEGSEEYEEIVGCEDEGEMS